MKKIEFLKKVEALLCSKKEGFADNIQTNLATQKRNNFEYLEYIYENGVYGKSYNKNFYIASVSSQHLLEQIERIIQPNRKFEVNIPNICVKDFIDRLFSFDFPKKIYKGVSYNQNLLKYGEKLDNLDFFSYLKNRGDESIIFDASCYHALNLLTNSKIYSGVSFQTFIIDEILECVNLNSDLRENSLLRKKYLSKMSELSFSENKTISMFDVLSGKESRRMFEENLSSSFKFCGAGIKDSKIDLAKFVRYKRNGSWFAQSYTPLVLAESLYARNTLGFDTKLGPISETGFDSFISKMHRGLNYRPMQFVWYTRPFEKNSSPETSIYTKDSMDTIRKKLNLDKAYAEWLENIICSFFLKIRNSKLEEKIEYIISILEK